jgi:hypothetical protein
VLRSLIDRVELRPQATDSGVEALLYGDLVAILGFCDEHQKRRSPKQRASTGQDRWLRGLEAIYTEHESITSEKRARTRSQRYLPGHPLRSRKPSYG